MNVYETLFVTPWPFWAAGGAIGLFVILFAWITGKAVGVSTGLGTACSLASKLPYFQSEKVRARWRLFFVLGIPLGGVAAALLAGSLAPTWGMGAFDAQVSTSPWVKGGVLLLGGALLGFGSRAAGGCTSGHAIVGVAQGARSSLIATAAFMVGGLISTNVIFALGGF